MEENDMLILRPVRPEDADLLFPLIYHSPVTDTLLWDGPDSLDEYRQGMARRAEQFAKGESFIFTIVVMDDVDRGIATPIGSAGIDLDLGQKLRADLGLWIGLPYHGKGYGTLVVRWLVNYGFARLKLEKIEASISLGNWASRRIFEKNGFIVEGAIRKATLKRGHWQDDWRVGITHEDYERIHRQTPILHITTQAAWQASQASGKLVSESINEVGFIHCSQAEQILWVANGYFRGRRDLVLLEIAPERVKAEVHWDFGENSFFPHIYGPLNIDAVMDARDLVPDEDGIFRKL
jgi:uncharacterized protein (DUF952 family)